MAAPKLTRKKMVLVQTEATEGTDAGTISTANNFLLCEEASVTPEVQVIERPSLKPYLSPLPSVVGGMFANWSITFELKGAGESAGAVDLPDWDPVFRACGMWRQTNDPAPAEYYDYFPATKGMHTTVGSIVSDQSMTLYLYEDGTVWKLTGCWGNLTISGSAGERVMCTAEGMGLLHSADTYAGNVDAVWPSSMTFDTELPPTCLSMSCSLDGGTANAATFSLDLGNEVSARPCVNKASGYLGFVITNRNPTGSIDPEIVAADDGNTDWFHQFKTSGDTGNFGVNLNTGAANGLVIQISAPEAQIVSFAEGDRNGVLTADLGLAFRRSSGDDEIKIRLT